MSKKPAEKYSFDKKKRLLGGMLLTGAVGVGQVCAQPAPSARTSPGVSSAKVTLQLVAAWSSQLTGMSQVLDRFTQRVLALTQGSLHIVYQHQDQAGVKAQDLLSDVASGKLDMAHSTSYYWTRRSVGFNFLQPFHLACCRKSTTLGCVMAEA